MKMCPYCFKCRDIDDANYCMVCGRRYPGIVPMVRSYWLCHRYQFEEFYEDTYDIIGGVVFSKIYELAILAAVIYLFVSCLV